MRDVWHVCPPCPNDSLDVFFFFHFFIPRLQIRCLSKIKKKTFLLTLQTLHQDILMSTKEEEWNNVLYAQNCDVVLRDRLMTDAALGGPRPIKSEHSYSLLVSSPPPSPATPGGNPHTPNSGSSSGTADSTATSTAASIDFAHLDHKAHELLRSRIDGKITFTLFTIY